MNKETFPFPDLREEIEKKAEVIQLQIGDHLIKEGNKSPRFYILLEGRVLLYRKDFIAELGRHDFFGETSLLTDNPWPYSVKSIRKTKALALNPSLFFDLIQKSSTFLEKILNQMKRDLDPVSYKSPLHSIAFVSLDHSDSIDGLLSELSSLLPQKKLEYFANDPKRIDDLKEDYDQVFLSIDWEKNDSIPTDLNQTADILLLHPETKASKKRAHIRTPQKISHVRKNHKNDMLRLARWIEGKTTGVVIGSSGARSFGALGALKAMEEKNIPIDCICGSGLGSVIAAMYAMEISIKEIHSYLKKITNHFESLFDYTFPFLAFLKGKKIEKTLQSLFQDLSIEDLFIPFSCVSSNLQTAKEYVHRRETLWTAVRASIATPGILPPVWLRENCLIDGNLTNILPIDIMRYHFQPRKIIAIDPGAKKEHLQMNRFPNYINGSIHLLKKIIPFTKSEKIPGIFSTIVQSASLDSSFKKQELLEMHPPDVLLNLPLDNFKILDFKKFDHLFHMSYDYAKTHLNP